MAGLGSYLDTAGKRQPTKGMVLVDPATGLPTINASGGLSYEDQQVLSGFGYTVSTSIIAVAAGNYLVTELANPANSGLNYIMSARVFADNVIGGQAPLEYLRYTSDAVINTTPEPTVVPIKNRVAGGAVAGGTFRYNMTATLPTVGTVSSSGFIPTNGEEKRIRDIVIIAPGQKLIYAVGGAGGGLAGSARIVSTFLFYTKPI